MEEDERHLALFEGKKIRKNWHNNQWYLSVIDVIEILTEAILVRS